MIETSIFNDFIEELNYQWGNFPLKNKENFYEQIKLKLITLTMPLCCQLQSQRLK